MKKTNKSKNNCEKQATEKTHPLTRVRIFMWFLTPNGDLIIHLISIIQQQLFIQLIHTLRLRETFWQLATHQNILNSLSAQYISHAARLPCYFSPHGVRLFTASWLQKVLNLITIHTLSLGFYALINIIRKQETICDNIAYFHVSY